ncbi:hypothetical protein C1752_00273 [Acaryochloris thomasi RCC1774]|uniref:DUF4926 domain-containing protein n=1 Tax=Acaryochloris thomasi RCC1774 TaxID=1764569 RepID=A0A2W1JQ72_9CYAN|nr:DUF4926 domain-containing protein [Acaryochloris thomasi]PZD75490.1 hypothetical protein C1752_00273 [Acaryochloris thomasi RCC1774]
MSLDLYQRITLSRDIPEEGLKTGDVAYLLDYVPHLQGGELGCVLEVFNAVGESISVLTVPESAIQPLRPDEILSARALVPTTEAKASG